MFAAVVRVLLLLGCVPLLHPPGVCACEVWAAALPPHDADADHPDGECPHCPGATTDAALPRPAADAPAPALAVALVVTAAPLAPEPVARSPVCPSAAWPSAPPLYLAHCALVR